MLGLLLLPPPPLAAVAWRAAWCSVRDPGQQQQALLGFAALALCQGLPLPDPPDILALGERERDRLVPRASAETIGAAVQAALLILLPEAAPVHPPPSSLSPAPPPTRRPSTGRPTSAGGAISEVPPPPNGAGPALIRLYHAALGSPGAPATPAARTAYLDALHARGA